MKSLMSAVLNAMLVVQLLGASASFAEYEPGHSVDHPSANVATKLDPVLESIYEDIVSRGFSPEMIFVEVIVSLRGEFQDADVDALLAGYQLDRGSLVPGDVSILVLRGTLDQVLYLAEQDSVIVIEGSRILDGDPGLSVGN